MKTTTLSVFLCLFLASNIAFATDEENGTDPVGGIVADQTDTEEECGFFCFIGEFFENLFS